MKAQRLLICVSLLIMVLLVSCFSPWTGEKGNLTIVWGKSAAARSFVDKEDLPDYSYEITLTGPGETIRETINYNAALSKTFTVTPGTWTVTIKGGNLITTTGNDHTISSYIELRVMGIEQVEVTPGKNASRAIPMYTATVVYSWDSLINLVNDRINTDPEEAYSREEMYVLKEYSESDFEYTETLSLYRSIILIAENNVTISRPAPTAGEPFGPFISVNNGGTLTLGLPGMTGTLTFDNGGFATNGSLNGSLIEAFGDGMPVKLTMNKGVTIKNGLFTDNGGGVYAGFDSTFIMNGGTITGNKVEKGPNADNGPIGGGVYMGYSGRFIRNGGTISGNTPDNVYYEKEEY